MNLLVPCSTNPTTPSENEVGALEDEWIAVRCQLGEREAFDELIQRWHGPIWQYVRVMIQMGIK